MDALTDAADAWKAGMKDEVKQKAEGRKQKAAKAKALCLVCLLPTAFCLLFFRPCFSKVILTSHLEPFIFHL